MRAPEFKGRNPEEIVRKDLTFDSAGYVYRGLSWLDYAKRQTSICALQYAALEIRQGIEQVLFEELVLSVGGALDRRDYERCKRDSTRLHKIVRRLSPDYEKLVSFVQAIMSIEPNAPRLIKWNHEVLMKHWGVASYYLHWGGEPGETFESPNWFVKGIEAVEAATAYLWNNMTSGYSGVMMPDKMQPEIRQAWEDYRAGNIDLEGVKRRAELAQPILVRRLES